MPLVANTDLPSFARLKEAGETVITRDRALHQDIRELHIGLLNMMPDKSLEATERQFFRLIGESNQIAQFYMHPFTISEIARGTEAREHIQKYYKSFSQIKTEGLDALIISGALPGPELSQLPFWEPLIEIMDWACEHVTSILCSCLATHAIMQFRYGKRRVRLPAKRWGVYNHKVIDQHHPLVAGVNTRFDVPHSRFFQIDPIQFVSAGLGILVESPEAGVHLAVSHDGLRIVMLQGHPEYDAISLMKEYKREVNRFHAGEIEEYPPFPENYFTPLCQAVLDEYRIRVAQTNKIGKQVPEFPEHLVQDSLDNTWHDSAEAVINNWIGMVYQLTHIDRRIPFRDGVDPETPLEYLNNRT